MVFGMISTAGTGTLMRLHGKINATIYKDLLRKHVPNLRTAINQPAVFMPDNVLCYIAKSVPFCGGCYCYRVACSKPRHESYLECSEVNKWKS